MYTQHCPTSLSALLLYASNPEAICRCCSLPMSIYSQNNFAASGCSHTLVITPTRISSLEISISSNDGEDKFPSAVVATVTGADDDDVVFCWQVVISVYQSLCIALFPFIQTFFTGGLGISCPCGSTLDGSVCVEILEDLINCCDPRHGIGCSRILGQFLLMLCNLCNLCKSVQSVQILK